MNELLAIGSVPQERVGPIWVALSPRGLVGVHMKASETDIRERYSNWEIGEDVQRTGPVLEQLSAYFGGKEEAFDVAIDWLALASFQRQVLQLVYEVPYGQTTTYQDIAMQLGNPGAARAVGRANATNPMPLIVPCHRVLGADGTLHGYGGPGGVETKAWLLALEGSRLL